MKGVTLVEVIVSGFVLGLFLLFSLQPLITANRATEMNRERQQREFLAHQLLQQAVLVPEARLQPAGGQLKLQTGREGGRTLNWTLKIEETDANQVPLSVVVTDATTGDTTTLTSTRFVSGGY
ncbi:MAG: hypothetical protein KC800_16045, partial [Candidatus Eremiobacteraeota bacterium]|nr:hypothetical protein [Candidatus Eremiobacteraeota bacterium]